MNDINKILNGNLLYIEPSDVIKIPLSIIIV